MTTIQDNLSDFGIYLESIALNDWEDVSKEIKSNGEGIELLLKAILKSVPEGSKRYIHKLIQENLFDLEQSEDIGDEPRDFIPSKKYSLEGNFLINLKDIIKFSESMIIKKELNLKQKSYIIDTCCFCAWDEDSPMKIDELIPILESNLPLIKE